jgi:environmental stress-induced protein Ves
MATITPLPRSGHTAMPWRNGGGTTHEIAIAPTDTPDAPFCWRLSIADLAGDGPFSEFPGIDRILLLLEGEGVTLEIGDAPATDLPVGEPIAFPADVPTHLTMTSPRGRDLNLMWDRARVEGAMVVADAGAQWRGNTVTITIALEPAVVVADGAPHVLDRHDGLRIDGSTDLSVTEGTVAIVGLRAR